MKKTISPLACGLLAAVAGLGFTPEIEIDWYTIDGGGAMFSTSGDLSLGGTIGQHDAGQTPMTGGGFSIVGGFWAAASTAPGCTCPGDVNGDTLIDGDDVQDFVDCLIGGESGRACADLDGGGVGVSDVSLFVGALLSGAECP